MEIKAVNLQIGLLVCFGEICNLVISVFLVYIMGGDYVGEFANGILLGLFGKKNGRMILRNCYVLFFSLMEISIYFCILTSKKRTVGPWFGNRRVLGCVALGWKSFMEIFIYLCVFDLKEGNADFIFLTSENCWAMVWKLGGFRAALR